MTYQITTSTYGHLLKITEDVNEYVLSDHNRAPVSMDPQRIEVSRRLANGTRRRYYVADKRTFQVSWNMLPSDNTQTVDGGVGAEELSTLYYNTDNVGIVQLNIAKRNLTVELVDVHITDFSLSLSKRFTNGHYYDVSMTFEEV
jgi:hypothetical protein